MAEVRYAGSELFAACCSCSLAFFVENKRCVKERTSPRAYESAPCLQAQNGIVAFPRTLHGKVGIHGGKV